MLERQRCAVTVHGTLLAVATRCPGPAALVMVGKRLVMGHAAVGLCALVIFAHTIPAATVSADELGTATPSQSAATSPEDSPTITMNFQNIEVGALARFVSEATGQRFDIDDRLTGTVTIVAPEELRLEAAYAVFQSLLQVKGFTALPVGRSIKIVPSKASSAAERRASTDRARTAPGAALVTYLVQVHHLDATAVARMLEPLVSRDGLVQACRPANMLLLVDTAADLQRLLTVLQSLDVDRGREHLELVSLAHAAAAELGPTLTMLVARGKPGSKAGARAAAGTTIVAEERTNSLLIRGRPADINGLRSLIGRLDVPPPDERARLSVHPLTYADAEAVVALLRDTLGREAGGSGPRRVRVAVRRRPFPTPPGTSLAAAATPGIDEHRTDKNADESSPELFGKVRITADRASNALLISAAPENVAALTALIQRLDASRPQVYLEAIILETSAEWVDAMGFDFDATVRQDGPHRLAAIDLRDLPATFAERASEPGLIVAAASNDTVRLPDASTGRARLASLAALERDNEIHVLSAPNLFATDDEEAEIIVRHSIPFATRRVMNLGEVGDLAAIVERRDVDITLRLRLRIIADDAVRLAIHEKISVPVTAAKDDAWGTAVAAPTSRVRSASTRIVAGDGNAVIVADRLAEATYQIERDVPYLIGIPLLGTLLKQRTTVRMKTNLLVLLTPHILQTRRMPQGVPGPRHRPLVAEPSPGRLSQLRFQRRADLTSPAEAGPEHDDAGNEPPRTLAAKTVDWEVQAGATRTEARAQVIVRKLAARGYRAFIFRPEESDGRWYRVRIGGLRSHAEARALARELIGQGIDGAFVPGP